MYQWTCGAKFAEIIALTKDYEGGIVRLIRAIHDLILQMSMAAFAMGDQDLKLKLEETATKIKRGIVFAQSLYT